MPDARSKEKYMTSCAYIEAFDSLVFGYCPSSDIPLAWAKTN